MFILEVTPTPPPGIKPAGAKDDGTASFSAAGGLPTLEATVAENKERLSAAEAELTSARSKDREITVADGSTVKQSVDTSIEEGAVIQAQVSLKIAEENRDTGVADAAKAQTQGEQTRKESTEEERRVNATGGLTGQ